MTTNTDRGEKNTNHWALIVAGLYAATIAILAVPFAGLALGGKVAIENIVMFFASWQCWVLLTVMFLSQYALLALPLRVSSRRPVTRGALWPTVLVGGLMMGILVVGAGFSITEFVTKNFDVAGLWTALALGLMTWVIWAVVFFRLSRRNDPANVITRGSSALIKGSVLELLIAVPTHIVARDRHYCCAGLLTFIGLTAGVSVMLFAFGPAVFFLFVERWKRLHPTRPA